MVLVDIYVPSVDRIFDFSLDENTRIIELLEEIAGIVEQNSKSTIASEKDKLILCSYDKRTALPSDSTLYQCGICNGSKLLMV